MEGTPFGSFRKEIKIGTGRKFRRGIHYLWWVSRMWPDCERRHVAQTCRWVCERQSGLKRVSITPSSWSDIASVF